VSPLQSEPSGASDFRSMRVILFDVDHGFSAFIKTPNGHSILIDCGKAPNFSPTEYLLKHEISSPLTKLIVSHAHADHIEDFESVSTRLNPTMPLALNLNWNLIKNSANASSSNHRLDEYVRGKDLKFSGGWVPDPDYGVVIVQSFNLDPNRAQQISSSINSAVNNCSIVTIVTFKGAKYQPKFLFGGDMEEAGWEELLKTNPAFRQAVWGTWFHFVSHHGHSTGFSTKLFEAMGKPCLNLVSVRHNDESRDSRYSDTAFSNGWPIKGDSRRMVSTTCNGSIFIDIAPDGLPNVHAHFLPDNITSNTTETDHVGMFLRNLGLPLPPLPSGSKFRL
jgi:beta-lactamase superfamily II metal-dependent hydrolase